MAARKATKKETKEKCERKEEKEEEEDALVWEECETRGDLKTTDCNSTQAKTKDAIY